MGKSMLYDVFQSHSIRTFITWNTSAFQLSASQEFSTNSCDILGIQQRCGNQQMFKAIQEQIYYLYHEKDSSLLLAIDEAQYLSAGILNDIKMPGELWIRSPSTVLHRIPSVENLHLNNIPSKTSNDKHLNSASPFITTIRPQHEGGNHHPSTGLGSFKRGN